ncbi:MAG TPA: class I SAM-dependent methyltransferase [Deltaproteobacteria bacterium]|nr:class I SAM-dependent methyltransferase [Deltaproteobacteria bacterium]
MRAYEDPEFERRLGAHLAEHGLGGSGPLAVEALHGVDQFHTGGPAPILRLIEHGELRRSDRVLDLGAGLGGVSRLVAGETGSSVLGIDATRTYLEAARSLTARCGLQSAISFVEGDVTELDLDDGSVDVALLVHVQVNIEHKADLFRGLRRVLRPAGKLLLWEIVAGRPGELPWPMPWSLDGSESHLATIDELRGVVESAGFAVRRWEDRSEPMFAWARRVQARGSRPSLAGVLLDGHARISNLGEAILARKVSLVEGVCDA